MNAITITVDTEHQLLPNKEINRHAAGTVFSVGDFVEVNLHGNWCQRRIISSFGGKTKTGMERVTVRRVDENGAVIPSTSTYRNVTTTTLDRIRKA
jgi:hypothetical protein